jgi:hypothetical protein
MKWQPIETAPCDGTEILLWCEEDGRQWCEVGFFGECLNAWNTWTEGRDLSILPATHWMPLPPAPEEET